MSVTTPQLDLIILDTHNPYTLAVADGTIYPSNFNVVSPTIEIKVPDYPTKSMSFVPENVQLYNSISLGLTCDEDDCPAELPDGIYRIKYSFTPAYRYYIEKYFLKVDKLYEKFDRAFLKLDIFQCDTTLKEQDKKTLDRIEYDIQGAIAAANMCNQKLAIELYQKASKKLEAFLSSRCY